MPLLDVLLQTSTSQPKGIENEPEMANSNAN